MFFVFAIRPGVLRNSFILDLQIIEISTNLAY